MMSQSLYRLGHLAARRPWVVIGSWLVLTRQNIQSAHCAWVVQIFWPVTTYWSPSLSAFVLSAERSEPAPGSE